MDIIKEAERIAKEGMKDERDLAIAIEIMQEYSDRLQELEDSDLSHLFKQDIEINIEGSNVRFDSIDDFDDFAAGVMYR